MSLEGSELYGDTSMADSDTVNSLNSTAPMRQTGTKSSGPPKFKAWSFRLTFKADFASAVDKGKCLQEHISERIVHGRPQSVTSQIAFYDATLLSGVPDSDGLVSIALRGYVQTETALESVQCKSGLSLLCGRRSLAAWQAMLILKRICSGLKTQTILGPSSLHLEASG